MRGVFASAGVLAGEKSADDERVDRGAPRHELARNDQLAPRVVSAGEGDDSEPAAARVVWRMDVSP